MFFLKKIMIISLFAFSVKSFSGNQYIKCDSHETEIEVCWQTSGDIFTSSTETVEKLLRMSFRLFKGQSIYTNRDRSILIQTSSGIPQLLIDKTNKAFILTCSSALNGSCD